MLLSPSEFAEFSFRECTWLRNMKSKRRGGFVASWSSVLVLRINYIVCSMVDYGFTLWLDRYPHRDLKDR